MKRFPYRTAPCRFATLPGKTVACAAGKAVSVLLLLLSVIPAMGQGRQVLTDGISGRDRVERLQFIQAFSPASDTCLVMTDSLGCFEVDPELMDEMRGNVYLKPLVSKPKPKLTLVNPFDSIDFYRRGRGRYLVQNHISETERDDDAFFFDPEVTVLKEAMVKARRSSVGRDKVTGYLDSLMLQMVPEWVCEHGYLNDYRGYTHNPLNHPGWDMVRTAPKRGEVYRVVKYVRVPGGWNVLTDHEVVYEGPQYTEEDLLEMYGMSKAQGYHPVREFYEPDELDLASPTPDYRNLLQWRPAVLTDENGIAEIPFAASDVNTEFVGLVEAVDGTGLMGAQTVSFRVFK